MYYESQPCPHSKCICMWAVSKCESVLRKQLVGYAAYAVILTSVILIFQNKNRFSNNVISFCYYMYLPFVHKKYSSLLLPPTFHWVPNKPELIVQVSICRTFRYRSLKHAQNGMLIISALILCSMGKCHQLYFITSQTSVVYESLSEYLGLF